MDEITVRSHVGRDLLQSAQVFNSDRKVVWEYVANSLQYSEPNCSPRILVQIDERRKTIRILDNGRGMDRIDLRHFFTMHAENRDRTVGRVGRGLFGTGKSAAFGIGDALEVTSVRNGQRTVVRLTRQAIEAMSDGSPIPVEVLVSEEEIHEPNGTQVAISQIHLRRIDRAAIIHYIERHISQYPRDIDVFIDHHQCVFKEPEAEEAYSFKPSARDRDVLGDVDLTVKVARGPLDQDLRGVQVFSHGNWHTTTLAGSEGKKMSEYLFGDVDIPALEDYKGPMAPFDNTRSGELNSNNPIVIAIFRFLGPAIDEVRRSLVARERERAKDEEVRRLSREADRIAAFLSEDFAAIRAKIRRAQAIATGRHPLANSGTAEGIWTEGGEIPARPIELPEPVQPEVSPPYNTIDPRPFTKPVEPDERGELKGKPAGGAGSRRSTRGGFLVEYKHAGREDHRGRYFSERRTIVVNLDHPQIEAAYTSKGPDSTAFVQLTWEVAVAEYAMALSLELVEPHTDPDEAIFDVRETIDRISRKLSTLYRGE